MKSPTKLPARLREILTQQEINLRDEDRYILLPRSARCPMCFCRPYLDRKNGRYRVFCAGQWHDQRGNPKMSTDWTRYSHEAVRAWELAIKLAEL